MAQDPHASNAFVQLWRHAFDRLKQVYSNTVDQDRQTTTDQEFKNTVDIGQKYSNLTLDDAILSEAIDLRFHRFCLGRPDLTRSEALENYHTQIGFAQDPIPGFSNLAYMERYSEVIEGAQDPFLHYLKIGRSCGYHVVESDQASAYSEHNRQSIDALRPYVDAPFYLRSNPDVAKAGMDAAEHYWLFGADEGRDPSAVFSTGAYIAQHPAAVRESFNPILHWIEAGMPELGGPDTPIVAFQPAIESPELIGIVLRRFDSDFYLRSNPDLTISVNDAVMHYLSIGHREGRDPSPTFSVVDYLAEHGDVRRAGVNPYVHYLEWGEQEGRRIRPSRRAPFARPRSEPVSSDERLHWTWAIKLLSRDFDADYYRKELGRTCLDDQVSDAGAAAHYFFVGGFLGLNPGPRFSSSFYLTEHPDVAQACTNPYYHYLATGESEGRATETAAWNPPGFVDPVPDDLRLRFNEEYYLDRHPDVGRAGVDAFDHFMEHGWREGRDPTPFFSVDDYLRDYPDVKAAGINPFVHYWQMGRSEGRLPRIELGFRYDLLKRGISVEQRLVIRDRSPREAPAFSAEDFLTLIGEEISSPIFLSISHDNYLTNVGGVQLCLMREEPAIRAGGMHYLHIFPHVPTLVVADDAPMLIGVNFDGRYLGTSTYQALANAIQNLPVAPGRYAVHSLLGHDASQIGELLSKADLAEGLFWIHDYAAVCAGYTLLRNDVEFCAAPSQDSVGCSICMFGGLRSETHRLHADFLDRFQPRIVAPSAAALRIWENGMGKRYGAPTILPHSAAYPTDSVAEKRVDQPIRVGFLGHPAPHKGWGVFRELALSFESDPRYEFVHLGSRAELGLPIEFHPVSVTAQNLDAMIKAVREHDIDIALLWSIWPETFCFTAYEAVAGGAIIITFQHSGNVADFVSSGDHGIVLESEAALERLLTGDELRAMITTSRRRGCFTLEYSRMSADIFAENEQ